MKKIIFICTLLVSLFAMSGCSDDIDTPVLTTDEYPRILGRWPDKQEDGTLGKFSIPLNQVLSINVQYTPALNFARGHGIWMEGKFIRE